MTTTTTNSKKKKAPGPFTWLVAAASVVVLIAGLRSAQGVLVPVVLSAFLAVLSAGPVRWLQARRVPTGIAVFLVVLANVLAVVGVGLLLVGSVNEFTQTVPRYQAKLETTVTELAAKLQDRGIEVQTATLRQMLDPGALLGMVATTLRGLVGVLSNGMLVVITLMFILLEVSGFPAKLKAAFPKTDLLDRGARVAQDVHHYLWIKTGISLATGVLIGVWVHFMDVDMPVLWGLLAFFLNFIPTIGSIIAAIPPIALALMQFGFGSAMGVTAGYLVVNTVLGNIIDPQLMGRRLGLSALVVFLSVLGWGWIWGPVGMLLAVPLTMCVKIVLENTDDLRWIAVLLDSDQAIRAAPARAGAVKPTTAQE